MTTIYILDKTINNYNVNLLYENLKYECIKEKKHNLSNETSLNSLLGYSLLQKYLKEDYNYTSYNMNIDSYGKPHLEDIYFNISHSHNLVCVVISNNECGIDIELIDKTSNYDLTAIKTLTLDEYEIYKNNSDKAKYFISCFTKKEAYLKYKGTGIILSKLKEIEVDTISLNIYDNTNLEYILSLYPVQEYNIKKDCTL